MSSQEQDRSPGSARLHAAGSSSIDASGQARPALEPWSEVFDELQFHQIRNAAAEILAAVAHAMGTPLNVISGRAELIRQDPANAAAQVTRIEDQVRKLAMGLRQMVDYLSVPETPAAAVPVPRLIEEALTLTRATAERAGVRLTVDAEALGGSQLDRMHALSTLTTLLSLGIRSAAALPRDGADERRVHLRGSLGGALASFEVLVPGLTLVEGWHLEHFQERPTAAQSSEAYQVISVCASMARGRGGKVTVEALPAGSEVRAPGIMVRYACRVEAASAAS